MLLAAHSTIVQVKNESSLLGPILVAVGAVAAAILTVITANWRQSKQLKQDRELQRAQLERDRELRQEELAHDREMRYRERVQLVVDETVAQQGKFREAFTEYVRAIEQAERDLPEGSKLPLDRATELIKQSTALTVQLTASFQQTMRLTLRLGQHRLVDLHGKISERTKEAVPDEDWDGRAVRTQEQRREFEDAKEAVELAHTAFLVGTLMWNFSLIAKTPGKLADAVSHAEA